MRIAIANKHPLERLGLRVILNSIYYDSVTWEAASSEEMMMMIEAYEVDLLIVDCHTLGTDAQCVAFIRKVIECRPRLPIIALTTTRCNALASIVAAAGASFVLPKGAEPQEIISTCRRLHAHKHTTPPTPAKLTALEWHVLQLLADGNSLSTVSDTIGRKSGNVSRIKSNAMRKLGVSNNLELHTLVCSWRRAVQR